METPPEKTALSDLSFSLVGSGRVGQSLASWAVQCGAHWFATAGREPRSAPFLVTALDEFSSAEQDLLLIAVSDRALEEVAATLAARPQARIVLHTSGALAAEVLAPLRTRGSQIGTLHPLKAFPHPLPNLEQAAGTFFALDGDPEAIALGQRIAQAWRGEAAQVPAESRILYHFAATLAAGGVATLLSSAIHLGRQLGLPEAVARGYLELARGALEATAKAASDGGDPARAITGPAARGDVAMLEKQFQALARGCPGQLALARELSEVTKELRAESPLSLLP